MGRLECPLACLSSLIWCRMVSTVGRTARTAGDAHHDEFRRRKRGQSDFDRDLAEIASLDGIIFAVALYVIALGRRDSLQRAGALQLGQESRQLALNAQP